MPRDNEKIIEICSNLSAAVKRAAIDLLEADAPLGMVQEILNSARILNQAPEGLCIYSESEVDEDYSETSIALTLADAMEPFNARLDKLFARMARIELPNAVVEQVEVNDNA